MELQESLNKHLKQGQIQGLQLHGHIRKLNSLKATVETKKREAQEHLEHYVDHLSKCLQEFRSETLLHLDACQKSKLKLIEETTEGYETEIDTLDRLSEEAEKYVQFFSRLYTDTDRQNVGRLIDAFKLMLADKIDEREMDEILHLEFKPAISVDNIGQLFFGCVESSLHKFTNDSGIGIPDVHEPHMQTDGSSSTKLQQGLNYVSSDAKQHHMTHGSSTMTPHQMTHGSSTKKQHVKDDLPTAKPHQMTLGSSTVTHHQITEGCLTEKHPKSDNFSIVSQRKVKQSSSAVPHQITNSQSTLSHQKTDDPSTVSNQKTDDPSTVSHQKTDDPSTVSHQKTYDPSTVSHQRTEDPSTVSRQKTDDPSTVSHQKTDDPSTVSHQKTDDPSTVSHQKTEDPSTVSYQKTDAPSTVSHQETDDPSIVSHQKADDPSTVSHQKTDDPSTVSHQKTDDPSTVSHQKTDDPSTATHQVKNSKCNVPHQIKDGLSGVPHQLLDSSSAMPNQIIEAPSNKAHDSSTVKHDPIHESSTVANKTDATPNVTQNQLAGASSSIKQEPTQFESSSVPHHLAYSTSNVSQYYQQPQSPQFNYLGNNTIDMPQAGPVNQMLHPGLAPVQQYYSQQVLQPPPQYNLVQPQSMYGQPVYYSYYQPAVSPPPPQGMPVLFTSGLSPEGNISFGIPASQFTSHFASRSSTPIPAPVGKQVHKRAAQKPPKKPSKTLDELYDLVLETGDIDMDTQAKKAKRTSTESWDDEIDTLPDICKTEKEDPLEEMTSTNDEKTPMLESVKDEKDIDKDKELNALTEHLEKTSLEKSSTFGADDQELLKEKDINTQITDTTSDSKDTLPENVENTMKEEVKYTAMDDKAKQSTQDRLKDIMNKVKSGWSLKPLRLPLRLPKVITSGSLSVMKPKTETNMNREESIELGKGETKRLDSITESSDNRDGSVSDFENIPATHSSVVNTQVSYSSDVNTQATCSSDVNTQANHSSDVNTQVSYSSDVNTQGTYNSDVNTPVTNSSDINTQAINCSVVNSQAMHISDVNSQAMHSSDVNSQTMHSSVFHNTAVRSLNVPETPHDKSDTTSMSATDSKANFTRETVEVKTDENNNSQPISEKLETALKHDITCQGDNAHVIETNQYDQNTGSTDWLNDQSLQTENVKTEIVDQEPVAHEEQAIDCGLDNALVGKSDTCRKRAAPISNWEEKEEKSDSAGRDRLESQTRQLKKRVHHFLGGARTERSVNYSRLGALQGHWLQKPGTDLPGSLLHTFSEGLSFPIGVTTDRDGRIVVTDTGNNLVKIFSVEGKLLKTVGDDIQMRPTLRRPSALVVNEDNEIFVKDDSCIFKFSSDGDFMMHIGKNILSRPYGLDFTPWKHLITLDTHPSHPALKHFSQDGTEYTSYMYAPLRNAAPGSKCRFMAVSDNYVIVSDLGMSQIYVTNLQGEFILTFGHHGIGPLHFNEPSGVSADVFGNVVIGDSKNNRIKIYRPDGSFTGLIELDPRVIRPSGLHFTKDNKLIVVNFLHHKISVYQL